MRNKKGRIRGIARNVNWRKVGENWDILTFRVEKVDDEGNIIDYVPVTMEGLIKGNVADGDEVEVTGKIDSDGLLNAESIYNIRTKAYIRPKTGSGLLIIPFIFVCLFIIFGVFGGLTEWRHGSGPFTGLAMFFFILGVISFIIIFIISALKK